MNSYPSVYTLGHRAIAELLQDPVVVEEKVDGSQLSFWLTDDGIQFRSKSADIHIQAAGMFQRAVAVITPKPLHLGWVYRGEYLMKPKHNALAYDRVPTDHVIIFDIQHDLDSESYLTPAEKRVEAERIGLECVPVLFEGRVESVDQVKALLHTPSCLGGQLVEGVVIKNYARFGRDHKVLMGKHVSEAFKEVHAREWKSANPQHSDILDEIVARFRTPARWMKAVQHLQEAGQLEQSPRDIGQLFKAVPEDVLKECEEEIKGLLFQWAWKKRISRGITAGLAEWYKERLLSQQFTGGEGT